MWIDEEENNILTGYTTSSDFSTYQGYDSTFNEIQDAILMKISSEDHLMWSTVLGGILPDKGIAVFGNGIDLVIVMGSTKSLDGSFPEASLPIPPLDVATFFCRFSETTSNRRTTKISSPLYSSSRTSYSHTRR